MKKKHTNQLIKETSPYLLQHAHNPVNWYPWNEDTMNLAKKENKPLLISVGYAACHWCHVMEEESFESEDVATVMNTYFINVKVDREERPDIDQVYMNAIQLMTGSGGWPMNVIALPDGRPFWGGTYFRKEHWIAVLNQIANLYTKDLPKIEEYAVKLQEGIRAINLIDPNNVKGQDGLSGKEIDDAVKHWKNYFDWEYGGPNRAPKFMMPVNMNFLLNYGHLRNSEQILTYVNTTLIKMAYGGLYDHVGGGFSRYSVDSKWHVPHFEKMLYDNAQLVSLYSNAWLATKNELYKKVVTETLAFAERELKGENPVFYSSLDADSKDENNTLKEGAFYVWKTTELQHLLKDNYTVFADYFNVNDYGYWEEGNYVLIRKENRHSIAEKHHITETELQYIIDSSLQILFNHREKRPKPRLDDKSLTSWNGLMIKAFTDAYCAFQNDEHIHTAKECMNFVLTHLRKDDGGLWHNYKNGKTTINGFLEDYATIIEALIALYEVTSEADWLHHARDLINYCFDNFFDETSCLFYFTSKHDPVIVSRSFEKSDNVIPASNSIMALNLFKAGQLLGNTAYIDTSKQMLNTMREDLASYGYSHANWLLLYSNFTGNFYEIAILGENAEEKARELLQYHIPNKVLSYSNEASALPLLKNRFVDQQTLIYLCKNNQCDLPHKTTEEIISAITLNNNFKF